MPAARLLDLTRLVSRVGRGPLTGIDRVERAYLDALILQPEPLFALIRTTLGYVLLAPPGVAALRARLTGAAAWGSADLIGRLSQRRNPMRARAEADLRRLAQGRARPSGLSRLLARHLPAGTAYLNVGHSDLARVVFDAVRQLPGARITVMIHDTIPLDHPDFAVAGMPAAFAARLERVGAVADLVLYNSGYSRRMAEAAFGRWGRVPPGLVAPLGVEPVAPDPALLPPGLDLAPPYFLALGTIEPRKNLGFLLDLWEDLGRDPPPTGLPRLLIVGQRGWADPALLARLDALPPGGPVRDLGGLPDGAVAALMAEAAGLLFPSLAEGYGLPPIEAAALGLPVVCNPLEIYQETLGNYPVYAPVRDRYLWRKAVTDLTARAGGSSGATGQRQAAVPAPSWERHFKPVLRLT
ncbi:MAG: glycosyltransferase [Rhodobacteraceae bacterium]|nr:glycosyltransferase [Paracoccaceae bacterium]